MYIVWNAGETSSPAGITTGYPPKLTPSAWTPVTEGLSKKAEPKSKPTVPMDMLGGPSPDSLFQLKLGHWKLLHYHQNPQLHHWQFSLLQNFFTVTGHCSLFHSHLILPTSKTSVSFITHLFHNTTPFSQFATPQHWHITSPAIAS